MSFSPMYSETVGSENVRDWWESITRLSSRDMMDMGGVGEVGRLINNVASHRLRLMPAREALIERGGLNNAFVSKLLMGRRYDG